MRALHTWLAILAFLLVSAPVPARGGIFDDIGDVFDNIGDAVSDAADTVADKVSGYYNNAVAFLTGGINSPSYPDNRYGPLIVKTSVVFQFLINTNATSDFAYSSEILELSEGTYVTVYHSGLNQALLIFWTEPGSSSGLSPSDLAGGNASVPYLAESVPTAAFPEAALSSFAYVVESGTNGTLLESLSQTFGDAEPLLHVIVAGADEAGTLAHLAGPWAALAFPAASVDVFTFGTPFLGNPPFAWAFDQLVTLSYLWSFNVSDVNATAHAVVANASSAPPDADILPDALQALMTEGEVEAATVTALQLPPEAPTAPEVEDDEDYLEETLGGLTPLVPGGSLLVSPEQAAELTEDPSAPPACVPLLCRARFLIDASCWLWTAGQNASLLGGLPRTFIHREDTGANVVVAWEPSTETAIVVWEGSITAADWAQDALAYQTDDFRPASLNGTFGDDVQVHRGFYNQFKSVTTAAPNDATNVTAQILALSGGTKPRRVLAAGHSLGSALASLTGVWISTIWTNASVSVVASGTPFVGNKGWVREFRGVVGKAVRFVYEADIVASVPPFDGYKPVPDGVWLTRQLGIAVERPKQSIQDLTFEDHHCDITYVPAVYNLTAVSVPEFILNVTGSGAYDPDLDEAVYEIEQRAP